MELGRFSVWPKVKRIAKFDKREGWSLNNYK